MASGARGNCKFPSPRQKSAPAGRRSTAPGDIPDTVAMLNSASCRQSHPQENSMDAIESVHTEHRLFPPSAAVVAQATISGRAAYDALCAEAEQDYAGFWARLAQ